MARIDIFIPSTFPDGLPQLADLTAYFKTAEDLGFGGLWGRDRLFHQTPVLDRYTLMVLAAAATTRVRIGSAVLLMPFRNPALFARQIATLDALSGGRENEHATVHATYKQRVRRLEESVEVLRLLFSEENVNYQGRYYTLDAATISPRPAQGAGLPILLGASSEAGLERAGRIADGWLAGGGGSPDQFAADWSRVLASARTAGRSTDHFQNGRLFYLWIDDDAERARAQIAHFVRAYYGRRFDLAEIRANTSPAPPRPALSACAPTSPPAARRSSSPPAASTRASWRRSGSNLCRCCRRVVAAA